MKIAIGNHELIIKNEPEFKFYYEKGIMEIIINVEDQSGDEYELYYLCNLEEPDLVMTGNVFVDL